MTAEPLFLSLENILTIHARMIAEFGEAEGIADRGMLESAAAMPSATFAGEFLHKSIPAMATAHLFHICRNRPFIDGNKRTAVVAAEIFLNINGMQLDASNEDLKRLCLGVAAGDISKEEAVAFFERHASG